MDDSLYTIGDTLFSVGIVGNFSYVIQLAKRCFVAGTLWRRHSPAKTDTIFTSEIGISRYLNDIAWDYVYGATPTPVLIEDDFLVHGSSLSKAVESFVDGLTRAIRRLGGEDGPLTRKSIMHNLYVRVYMSSNDALLLNSDIMERIYAGRIVDVPRLRAASIDLVRRMAEVGCCSIASTLCVEWPLGTFRGLAREGVHGRWSRLVSSFGSYPYNSEQCLYHLKTIRDDVVITLRAVVQRQSLILIPAIHHGDMNERSVRSLELSLLMCVRETSDVAERSVVVGMLEHLPQVPSLLYRVTFADMLLGQVAVSAFLRDSTYSLPIEPCNVMQVAEFYGMGNESEALEVFSRIPFGWDALDRLTVQLPGLEPWDAMQMAFADAEPDEEREEDALMGVVAAGYRHALSAELYLQTKQRDRAYAVYDHARRVDEGGKDAFHRNIHTHAKWADFVKQCMRSCRGLRRYAKQPTVDAVCSSIYALVDNDRLNILYVDNAAQRDHTVSQVVGPTEMSLSILPSVVRPEIWDWFKNTVTHCRIQGLSIEKTMRRLGYDDEVAEGADVLLGDVARELDRHAYLDTAVLDWEPMGFSWSELWSDSSSLPYQCDNE